MNRKHSMHGTPTYKSWSEMKYRCEKRKEYINIMYCKEWESFEEFYKDMGIRGEGLTLDRINVYGNYCKENCRWADIETQENNRTNNRYYFIDGEKLTLPQIARKYNIKRSTLANRIYIYGMDMDYAISYKRGGK